MYIWSDVNLWQLVPFFHHVGPGDHTQILRLGGRCPALLNHLASPAILLETGSCTEHGLHRPSGQHTPEILLSQLP